jgi:hypothetical protein
MAAAEITPTTVQKRHLVYNATTGDPIPVIEYLIYGTKATQDDWILHDSYTPGTYMFAYGGTIACYSCCCHYLSPIYSPSFLHNTLM